MEPSAAGKKGKLLIPDAEVARVMTEVAPQEGPTGLLKLAGIKNVVEGWCASHRFPVREYRTCQGPQVHGGITCEMRVY